jgi:predicted ATPase/class 3 adenylate cyclase
MSKTTDHSSIEPLSNRELEILRLAARGLSDREIARKLFLSPETVRSHNEHIYAKLDVHSRSQAVAKARYFGLIGDGRTASPSGTVTFLFTDIQGSTKLWEQHPKAMGAALRQHDELLRTVIEDNNGRVFKTVGDAFCAAFDETSHALSAAHIAQTAVLVQDWGETPIRIRIALHTGAAEARNEDYFGPTVNRVARLLSITHGGQILVSAATRALAQGQLPDALSFRDLDKHRLKDLERAERIYQLIAPDLPSDFPPLRSVDYYPNNLPVQLTSFIGREKEISEVRQHLMQTRLVTLMGAGGTGKTRLSQQAAARLVELFSDGVWLVQLAPLSDPALLSQTVATVLGVREEPDRALTDTLVSHLRSKELLLILDNCEHLVQDCAELATTLLSACPHLQILATSREALGVAGEVVFLVPPLSLPPEALNVGERELAQYEGVQLFMERAETALPGFRLTEQNAAAILQVCRRLDGMPLAIELAAARAKLLQVEQIATRLDDRFRLLTGGSRAALPRHQTLRAMIDWSYDLLSKSERVLLERLTVFAGGWTLEAAEAVCSGTLLTRDDILDVLFHLINKSLVISDREQGVETRYQMLETIRQYGKEKLIDSGEIEQVRDKHLEFYLALAEEAEPELRGPEPARWYEMLETEHDNLRTALEWSKQAHEQSGLQLAGTLLLFWTVRGYFSEGRGHLAELLQAKERTYARAKALAAAGQLAYRQSDYQATRSLYGECLVLAQELGAQDLIARALMGLGNVATEEGDYESAPAIFEEALAIYRELADPAGTANALMDLGWAAMRPGDYVLAEERLLEALALFRECKDINYVATTLSGLGEAALRQGDLDRAKELLEESLAIKRKIGDKWGIGVSLGSLGWIAQRQADYGRATAILSESLQVRHEIGDKGGMAWCLERLAEVALALRQAERSVRFFGAAAALRASIGSVIDPADQPAYERTISDLSDVLGQAIFAAAWDEGQAMTLEQAIASALSETR